MNRVKQILLIGTLCAAALWAGTRVVGGFDFAHIATPSAPASGLTSLYAKADGLLYMLPSGGSEALVQGVGRSSVKFATGGIDGTTGWDQDTWTELPGTSTEDWDIGGLHTGTNAYATANRTGKWMVTVWTHGSVPGGWLYVAPCVNGALPGTFEGIGAVNVPQFWDGALADKGYGAASWTGVLQLTNTDTVSCCVYRQLSGDDSADNIVNGGYVVMTDFGF